MPTARDVLNPQAQPRIGDLPRCDLKGASVTLIGDTERWFHVEREDEMLLIEPSLPLPRRCTIRPAALFHQDRGFPDINMVMGRLTFPAGATDPQRYRPYSGDPQRRLRELFLPVESMPDDDWPVSSARWTNVQAIARRLLQAAVVSWNGLSRDEVDLLVRFVAWPEPVEGCVLHALAQWRHDCGRCIIEIGSFRGRSLSMLALALRGVKNDSLLVSVDPHGQDPHNAEHVRLALRQIGEERRLVQMTCPSDQAWEILRPQCASMVFVDGDHSFSQVVADFEHYMELLAPGGVMVFHDYGYGAHNGRPEADPEVRPAIDQFVFGAAGLRPLLLAHSQIAFVKDPA